MSGFYEFFAGGGMVRAGLGPGWSCLFANDIDPKKAASYTRNWGDTEFCLSNVSELTTVDLPGKTDLAWASFPCQDLSLAGSGAGLQGKRSGTFWPFWNRCRLPRRGGATILTPIFYSPPGRSAGRDSGGAAGVLRRDPAVCGPGHRGQSGWRAEPSSQELEPLVPKSSKSIAFLTTVSSECSPSPSIR